MKSSLGLPLAPYLGWRDVCSPLSLKRQTKLVSSQLTWSRSWTSHGLPPQPVPGTQQDRVRECISPPSLRLIPDPAFSILNQRPPEELRHMYRMALVFSMSSQRNLNFLDVRTRCTAVLGTGFSCLYFSNSSLQLKIPFPLSYVLHSRFRLLSVTFNHPYCAGRISKSFVP